jgi:hypothetical protein
MSLLLEACKYILDVNNYNEYVKILIDSDNQRKGDLQEVFAKIYFESHATHYDVEKYYSRLLNDKIPIEYNLNPSDVGSDGVIKHKDSNISLVQVKFRSNPTASLLRSCISNMTLESGFLRTEGLLKHFYLFTNTYSV